MLAPKSAMELSRSRRRSVGMRGFLLGAICSIVIAGLVACGGGSATPSASETASPGSVTPPPSASATSARDAAQCPLEASACAFAESVVSAIRRADVDALEAFGAPQPIRCFGGNEGTGENDGPCAGSVAGESRAGYRIHRLNSDGGTAVADFRPDLREAVLNGSGAIGPVGIQCPEIATSPGCEEGFVLFLTGAPNVVIELLPSGYRITALQFGDFAQDRSLLQTGGSFIIPWKDTAVPGRFVPWRPLLAGPAASATIQDWLVAPLAGARLTLTPSEGPCPETLTVSGRGYTETVKDPKDPRLQIELLPGRYGRVAPIIRPRPAFTLSGPVNPDGTWESTITLTSADRYVCAAGVITVLVGGNDWAVAYYQVR